MLSNATLTYAEDLTPALMGVDALYRAEGGDDIDGLVVLNMSTTHRPEPFDSYAAARERLSVARRWRSSAGEPATCPSPSRSVRSCTYPLSRPMTPN
jgi:hypothetical protein